MIGTPFWLLDGSAAPLELRDRSPVLAPVLLQSAAAMLTPPGYAQAVRLEITPDTVEVRLSWWEKVLGLLKDIRVARADISDVQVVSDPVRVAMGSGIKAGLRLPWLLYVARTIRLDEAFVVRRREPGLSFAVRNHGTLKRVLVSTPRAEEIARQLQSGD
jgi:hypothetical protein